jgi:hypothetical protein
MSIRAVIWAVIIGAALLGPHGAAGPAFGKHG